MVLMPRLFTYHQQCIYIQQIFYETFFQAREILAITVEGWPSIFSLKIDQMAVRCDYRPGVEQEFFKPNRVISRCSVLLSAARLSAGLSAIKASKVMTQTALQTHNLEG